MLQIGHLDTLKVASNFLEAGVYFTHAGSIGHTLLMYKPNETLSRPYRSYLPNSYKTPIHLKTWEKPEFPNVSQKMITC